MSLKCTVIIETDEKLTFCLKVRIFLFYIYSEIIITTAYLRVSNVAICKYKD